MCYIEDQFIFIAKKKTQRRTISPKYLYLKMTEMEMEFYTILTSFAIRNTPANLTRVHKNSSDIRTQVLVHS